MDSVLREKLTQLTTKCDILQKNGKYTECIDIMEEVVSIKKNVYGTDHVEFEKSSEKLCEYLNLAAMILLQKEKFDMCLDYLRKAELVAQNSLQYKSTTYNNLACYYRRTGKLRTALSYLIQALELELKMQQPTTLADTHLNLCAVLSQLDKHEDAQQHAMLSIILLQDEFLQIALAKLKNGDDERAGEDAGKEISDERLAVLAIAYHNLGVEFQHMKRFQEALKIYNKALKLSRDYLSDNQQLVANLTKVVNSATEQIEEQKKNFVLGKKQKVDRQVSETKRDIYKDISRQVDRYRNLPKLRLRDDYPIIESDKLNQTIGESKTISRSTDRNFISKKQPHPRIYKSNARTPMYDDSNKTLEGYQHIEMSGHYQTLDPRTGDQ